MQKIVAVFLVIFSMLSTCRDDADLPDEDENGLRGVHNMIDPLLNVHDQIWEEQGEIDIDIRVNTSYNSNSYLKWGGLIVDNTDIKAFSFFRLLFPMRFLNDTIIKLTNIRLRAKKQPETSTAEFIKFLGLTLTMALEPSRGGLDSYWKTEDSMEGTIYSSRQFYSRFNMSRDRFKMLRSNFRCNQDENRALLNPTDPDNDPWASIRPFIVAFNDNRQASVSPGSTLTVDEVMSMWYGLTATTLLRAYHTSPRSPVSLEVSAQR